MTPLAGPPVMVTAPLAAPVLNEMSDVAPVVLIVAPAELRFTVKALSAAQQLCTINGALAPVV